MIKVIVGYRVKEEMDIQPVLLKIRANAMQYPGYVGAETLVRRKDGTIIIVITTWESVKDWREWDNSKIKKGLLQEMEGLLEDEPRITTYTVKPTVRWV